MKTRFVTYIFVLLLGQPGVFAGAPASESEQHPAHDWGGRQIMDEVYKRHREYPFIYEDQSMVLVDGRGQKDTRRLHRYSRVDEDGSIKYLLIFLSPAEVKGVSLLAVRAADGQTRKHVYLPALGRQMIESIARASEDNFLGSDFSIENLTGELLENYAYSRLNDIRIDNSQYFVIDAYRKAADPQKSLPLRRHYVRQDNFFITRSDHFDEQGRVFKQQSYHDLKRLDGEMWRASMILMQNIRDNHRTLLKIHHRIFSQDYVPAEMFTAEWLFENHPSDEEIPAGTPDDVTEEQNISRNMSGGTGP